MFYGKVSLSDSEVTFGQTKVPATNSTKVSTIIFFVLLYYYSIFREKVFQNNFYK